MTHHVDTHLLSGQNLVVIVVAFYSVSALLAVQTAVTATAILSVCPPVLPSHSGVLSRWMKVRSCGFQHQVGKSF